MVIYKFIQVHGERQNDEVGCQVRYRTNIRSRFQGHQLWLPANRSANDACEEIWKYFNYGFTEIVDIDISEFLNRIDHENMVDPHIIKFIRGRSQIGRSIMV